MSSEKRLVINMSDKTIEIKNSKQVTKTITVDYLARVEGRGALNICISPTGKIQDLQFRIPEPPRFFESFLIQHFVLHYLMLLHSFSSFFEL